MTGSLRNVMLLAVNMLLVLLSAQVELFPAPVLSRVCGSWSSASEREGTDLTPNAHIPYTESDSQARVRQGGEL